MGYTHYFGIKASRLTNKEREAIASGVKKIIKQDKFKDLLCYEFDEPDKSPLAHSSLIRFNGKGDEGHETFYLDLSGKHEGFKFCKTARKPYDDAVVEVLRYLAENHPDLFEEDYPSSDGYTTFKKENGEWASYDRNTA